MLNAVIFEGSFHIIKFVVLEILILSVQELVLKTLDSTSGAL
jgi:hypothetical protein